MLETKRIVTRQRGSWRWQNAFAVTTYRPRQRKDGRWIWYAAQTTGKFSEPQLRRLGYDKFPSGSLHNRLVDAELVQFCTVATETDEHEAQLNLAAPAG